MSARKKEDGATASAVMPRVGGRCPGCHSASLVRSGPVDVTCATRGCAYHEVMLSMSPTVERETKLDALRVRAADAAGIGSGRLMVAAGFSDVLPSFPLESRWYAVADGRVRAPRWEVFEPFPASADEDQMRDARAVAVRDALLGWAADPVSRWWMPGPVRVWPTEASGRGVCRVAVELFGQPLSAAALIEYARLHPGAVERG